VDCSGAEGEEKTPEKGFLSKKAALLQLVDQRPVSKTIVFCNKVCLHFENCFKSVRGNLGDYAHSFARIAVLVHTFCKG
jgi:hypothetical protein